MDPDIAVSVFEVPVGMAVGDPEQPSLWTESWERHDPPPLIRTGVVVEPESAVSVLKLLAPSFARDEHVTRDRHFCWSPSLSWWFPTFACPMLRFHDAPHLVGPSMFMQPDSSIAVLELFTSVACEEPVYLTILRHSRHGPYLIRSLVLMDPDISVSVFE